MASDGSSTFVGTFDSGFGQQLVVTFLGIALAAFVLTKVVVLVGRLRDPMWETVRAERRDARALRKEHAMPMWAAARNLRAGLKEACLEYFKRYHTTPRHARPEGEPPSELLLECVHRYRAQGSQPAAHRAG